MSKVRINQESVRSDRKWVRHKINPGVNIVRILPPFGDAEVHNNYPYKRWSVAWLLDPKTGKRRPYATPATDGEACPVREYTDALQIAIDKKLKALEATGASDSEIKDALKDMREAQWQMRVNTAYAYNAVNQAGEVGILELKSTAHKGVKKMMNQYIKDYGQDPTSLDSAEDDSGVWFNIERSGENKETKYDVGFHQIRQKMNGQLVKIDDRSALPISVVENYEELGYDLSSIYPKKDYDELKQILLFTVGELAKNAPGLAIEGYGAPEATPIRQVPVAQPKKAVNAKISIKVDADDLDDADDLEEVVQAAPAKRPVANDARARALAMANDILGDD